MRNNKIPFLIPLGLGLLLIAGLIALWPTQTAKAQCGSQASSCKNCHEVQAQDPVNNDGNGWHQSHAFGDFCYICHGGNNQSMDKTTAHTGMVDPLSDVNAACKSCHPNDLMDRAKVYATALGVQIGTGGSGTSGTGSGTTGGGTTGGSSTTGTTTSDQSAAPPAAPAEIVVDQADVIDYNQIYAGRTPINWGNAILIVLIILVAAGGGTYVYYNERKLRGLPFLPARKTISAAPVPSIPQAGGYSSEVLSLLPQIAQLSPLGLHALRRLLVNPEEASELLHSLSKLDPELVRRIRSLDRETRTILLALSGGD